MPLRRVVVEPDSKPERHGRCSRVHQTDMPNRFSVFDPQFHLDLESPGDSSASRRAVPDLPPTREQLASAALENTFVQEFIAERVPTWSEDRVRANPTCCLVYEHGEVVGAIDELPLMIRHAEKRSGMGMRLGVRPLEPAEEVLAFNIGLRWGPTHPRRIRFRQRRALRSLLARKDGVAVTEAMRRTKRDFVAWARRRPGLADRICDSTGLSMPAFWRAVRCRPPFRPPELTPVRREGGDTSPSTHGDQ